MLFLSFKFSYVYKPKNIYEGGTLPYIYGTKKWHLNWHVGLLEDEENNSVNDRRLDTYSTSSSSTPTDENESPESNSSLSDLRRSTNLLWKSSEAQTMPVAPRNDLSSQQYFTPTTALNKESSTSTDSLPITSNNFENPSNSLKSLNKNSNRLPFEQSSLTNETLNQRKNEDKPNSTIYEKNTKYKIPVPEKRNDKVATSVLNPPKAPPRTIIPKVATERTTPKESSSNTFLIDSDKKDIAVNKPIHGEMKDERENKSLYKNIDFDSFIDELSDKTQKLQQEKNNNEYSFPNKPLTRNMEDKFLITNPVQKEQVTTRGSVGDKSLQSIFSEDEEAFLNIYKQVEKPKNIEKMHEKEVKREGTNNALQFPIYDRSIVVHGPAKSEIPKVENDSQKVFIKSSKNEQKLRNLFDDNIDIEIPKDTNAEKSYQEKTAEKESRNNVQDEFQKKYDLKSYLFLDNEPPDDDDFFESLKKTKDRNYSSKLVEEENEEEQVLAPVKSPQSNNVVSNLQKSLQPPSNTGYRGFQLINDIPPDDFDDQPESTVRDTVISTSNPHLVTNIFYDDFNETIQAISQQPTISSSFCVFNEEPPPVDEGLPQSNEIAILPDTSIENNLPKITSENITLFNEEIKEDKLFDIDIYQEKSSSDVEKTDLWSIGDTEKKKKGNNDKLEKEGADIEEKFQSNNKLKAKNEASKVVGQVESNLNINVKALSPTAYDTSKKVEEQFTNVIDKSDESSLNDGREVANYNYILPSFNKNRIRGPLQRKTPSRKSSAEKQQRENKGIYLDNY